MICRLKFEAVPNFITILWRHRAIFPVSQAELLTPKNWRKMTKFKIQNHLYHSKALEKRYRGLLSEYSWFLNVTRENLLQRSEKRQFLTLFFFFWRQKWQKSPILSSSWSIFCDKTTQSNLKSYTSKFRVRLSSIYNLSHDIWHKREIPTNFQNHKRFGTALN